MKKILVVLLIVIAAILIFKMFSSSDQSPSKTSNIVTTTLVSVEGGQYVQAAGYYEGTLTFENTENDTQYPLFICLKAWPSYEINTRYSLDLAEIKNVSRSGELSGCYTRDLTPTIINS